MADDDASPSRSDDGHDDTNNSTLYAALIIVGLVLLLAAWVIWPRSDSDSDTIDSDVGAERPAPDTDTPVGSPEAGERAGNCPEGMPEGDDIPETAPDVDWQVHWTVALPFSDEHGPAVIDGDIARCYARTPTGALIASAQIDHRVLLAPDGPEVARVQTVPGVGQDRLVEVLEERGEAEADPGTLCQVAGYRFVTYSADEAVIASASRCPSSRLQLVEVRLRWVEGDWVMVPEDDGSLTPTVSSLADLSGMVTWGGV